MSVGSEESPVASLFRSRTGSERPDPRERVRLIINSTDGQLTRLWAVPYICSARSKKQPAQERMTVRKTRWMDDGRFALRWPRYQLEVPSTEHDLASHHAPFSAAGQTHTRAARRTSYEPDGAASSSLARCAMSTRSGGSGGHRLGSGGSLTSTLDRRLGSSRLDSYSVNRRWLSA